MAVNHRPTSAVTDLSINITGQLLFPLDKTQGINYNEPVIQWQRLHLLYYCNTETLVFSILCHFCFPVIFFFFFFFCSPSLELHSGCFRFRCMTSSGLKCQHVLRDCFAINSVPVSRTVFPLLQSKRLSF